ncbi:MAG: histidinol-phosphate aminotransferase family protein [Gemmatimonadaceae bacterium]|nr:histidinol-phosphate aminotransferase family protein [Gemmatimonadaceae bacterium]
MPQSRRAFLATAAVSGASLVPALQARGLEASWTGRDALHTAMARGVDPNGVIRLNSNENPYGPASNAIDAIMQSFGASNRYPRDSDAALRTAIARRHGVKDENVLIGAGSGETLRIATEAFTSASAHLVAAAPTFENPIATATRLGRQVKAPRVDARLRLDLDAMAAAAPGAGLVFVCNPNNPTGTVWPLSDVLALISTINRTSPSTRILVDEAYFEYCDLPGYDTAIPAALANPSILVTRTFSKIFGLAGMRVGYAIAHADTIRALEPWRMANGVSALSAAAAIASCELPDHAQRQAALNREVRDYTIKTINAAGIPAERTHTNFILADVGRDPNAFQQACLAQGVAIGRAFPPLDRHARISIGTMDEMKRALPIVIGLAGGRASG